jgi:hypothetical protein
MKNIDKMLKNHGKIMISYNHVDPSKDGPFEAWYYPSVFQYEPSKLGVGETADEALNNLEGVIETLRKHKNE